MRRRILVPEVVQTSGIDCGPAALKSALDGFGVSVSYGRLREACHTDVDGTSIDTIEDLAVELGLVAQQVIVPYDHLLLSEATALPAIAVVQNPDGTAHFVLAWRRIGSFVQVMDPARGRLWLPLRQYGNWLAIHTATVPAVSWCEWARSEEFLRPLDRRLRDVGLSKPQAQEFIATALSTPGWIGLAGLDAATRMLASLRSASAVSRRDVPDMLIGLLRGSDSDPARYIPDPYWSVRPAPRALDASEELRVRGVVVVGLRGRRRAVPATPNTTAGPSTRRASAVVDTALAETQVQPLREVARVLGMDGLLVAAIVTVALLVVVLGVVVEAVLFRSLIGAGSLLRLPEQGLSLGVILVGFASALLGVEIILASLERRAGRHLETRLRLAFLEKIPRLADAYFQSRPASDMVERSHSLQSVRQLASLGVRFLRVALELAVTAAALVWLNPHLAWVAVLAAVAAAGIPLLGQPIIAERDLRVRTHVGALARFPLDAVMGRTAIDAHGAAEGLERQHSALLNDWARSSLALQRASLSIEGLQMFAGVGLAGWMVFEHLTAGAGGVILLQLYWLLNLPALGYELALHAREYPSHRSTLLRLLEPLTAPDDQITDDVDPPSTRATTVPLGMRIDIQHASVAISGRDLLTDVDLTIAPGTHIAIVGASGAGKSTLIGLLLGWHRASAGEVLIDGKPIAGKLRQVRQASAWVDSTVRLWDGSLLENLLYGSSDTQAIGPALEASGLLPVLAKLPDGLSSMLGENGALLSAGEAQRVRLARAMVRRETKLALLDEPFIGLEADRRRALLSHVRRHWRDQTLLYVTHDLAETRQFDRVLVLDEGRVVEDGSPEALALSTHSRYQQLLQAQERMKEQLSNESEWHHIRLESGQIRHDHERAFEHTA